MNEEWDESRIQSALKHLIGPESVWTRLPSLRDKLKHPYHVTQDRLGSSKTRGLKGFPKFPKRKN